jgi:glucosamine-6-phosphate deaminase
VRLHVTDTAQDAGEFIAHEIALGLATGAIRVLGVATGASPIPIYEALAARAVSPRALELVALDEYVGLASSDPRSFAAYVRHRIATPLGVSRERTHVPDGAASDPASAAANFESTIDRIGPVDVQILGVGTNGHIGFNEPGSSADSFTRVVALSERTRSDNARYFGDEATPTHAITQGVATIMRARQLVLIATGLRKADAVAALASGVVTPKIPATLLRRHPDLVVVADADAASSLQPGSEAIRSPA